MYLKLTKRMALAASLIISSHAVAEGQADRHNEERKSKIGHVIHVPGHHQTEMPHDAYVDASHESATERGLTYTAGEALKTHPHLTAHERKYLVFGND